MPTTVHRPLDEELQALTRLLVRMSDLVDEQFTGAVEALINCDEARAAEIRRRDDEVDAFEMEVDAHCARILALHHPVADELRMLITAVKLNTDLERIGDHAKNIAKNVPHVICAQGALEATKLPEMADASRAMLHEAHEAFTKRDRLLARKVLAHDLAVDRLHRENFHALVAYGQTHPDELEAVAHLLTASKAMERISDHAKNVAEAVVFLIDGEDIRHRKLRPHAGDGVA